MPELAGDDVLRFVAGDKAGMEVRATRGEAAVRALGVTLGDWRDRRALAASDFSDFRVAVDLSLGAGESVSVREAAEAARDRFGSAFSGIGDIGELEAGGVGTVARASWSRRMEISLLASAVSTSPTAKALTSTLVLETLVFLLNFLFDNDFLFQQCLLLNGTIILDLHVEEGRDSDTGH